MQAMTTHMHSLPPGPREPSLVQTARLINSAETFFRDNVARYGDPFTARIRGGNIVFTGRPDLVRTIFAAPTDVIGPYAAEHFASVLGPHALLLLTGNKHKHERAMLAPLFHGAQIDAWSTTIVDVARKHLRAIPPGEFHALDLFQRVGLDVALQIMFAFDDARHQQALAIALDFIAAIHPLALFFDAVTRRVPVIARRQRWLRASTALNTFLHDAIRERRAQPARHDTVLDVLLNMRTLDGDQLSDSDIADELRTFLMTGHETTSGTMSWALDAVHRDAALGARLRDELATVNANDPLATSQLPLLAAVVDEAMRLHPVIPFVPKAAAVPFELGGHTLPVGTGVFVATALAHMNPTVFPEPTQFRPERFLERRPTAVEYFPFGGGVRRCVASTFAIHEMRLVLATMLRENRFSVVGRPFHPVHHGMTRGPSRRAPLVKLPDAA